MEWFRMQTIWGTPLKRMSDAEAGRFIKAVYDYVRDGKEYEGNGREELLVVQALETLQTDIEAFDKYQKDAEDKKQAVSDARRNAVNKRWDKRNSIQTDTNEYKSTAQDTNGTNSSYIKNKNKNNDKENEYEYENDNEGECRGENDTHARTHVREELTENGEIIGVDGLALDVSKRVQSLALAEQLAKRFRLPQSENVLQALADDLEAHGEETVVGALNKAAESDTRGGLSLNFYRAVLANKNTLPKAPTQNRFSAARVDPNLMITHTLDDRHASIRKATVDLDAYEI